MKSELLIRIRVISGIVFLVAIVMLGRLYFVQIMHGVDFSNDADRQYTNSEQELYNRGSIFLNDKDGRLVSGATLRSGFTIAISPKNLKDAEDAYKKYQLSWKLTKILFPARGEKE